MTYGHPHVSLDHISPYSSVILGTPHASPSTSAPLLNHQNPLAMWLRDISVSLLK
jgi:hypothetical protein